MSTADCLQLDRIVFIGRTFNEYVKMFDFDESSLRNGPVLDCATGLSSFTADGHAIGIDVKACDTLYDVPLTMEQSDKDMTMSDFEKSNWAKSEFSRGYLDNADVFIVERRRMLSVLQSLYRHFVKVGSAKAILDLGCGDGVVTNAIADVDKSLSATLVDGSEDMLAKARERLAGLSKIKYVHASFQELLRHNLLDGPYDFIVSSLAIHHLTMDEKSALFKMVYAYLNQGGHFVNIDVVLAPSEALEQWYLALWREWIDEKKRSLSITDDRFDDITLRYKEAGENKPDTLDDQLNALRATGFRDVDCYYKYGIFTVFGGKREKDAE